MATGLFFFLLLKGMSKVSVIADLRDWIASIDVWVRSSLAMDEAGPRHADAAEQFISYGMTLSLLAIWVSFGAVILGLISAYRERAASRVFPILAIVGMVAMAVAFGQNDLANCAAPGLATVNVLLHWDKGTAVATETPIWRPLLFGCGILLFLGMRTKHSTRVTKAAVQMGSHTDRVSLYAPKWCIAIAQVLVGRQARDVSLAPEPRRTEKGKKLHFDSIRACTIMGVSASVIALASSNKLPVSTTYVTMAAVIGSGMGDRIFQRGDAALKLARAIWVGISWFLAAFFAALFTGLVCIVVFYLELVGLFGVLAVNLLLRRYFKNRGDAQAQRARDEMHDRAYPERFATEDA
jgi:hypothetical protein